MLHLSEVHGYSPWCLLNQCSRVNSHVCALICEHSVCCLDAEVGGLTVFDYRVVSVSMCSYFSFRQVIWADCSMAVRRRLNVYP